MADAPRIGVLVLWPILASLVLALATAAGRPAHRSRARATTICWCLPPLAAAAVLALRLPFRSPCATRHADTGRELGSELLRDLLESAGPAVVAVGLDGRLTYVNPAAERLLGYHADELTQRLEPRPTFWLPAKARAWSPRCKSSAASSSLLSPSRASRLAAYLDCVALAAAQHGAQLRRAGAPQRRLRRSRHPPRLRAARRRRRALAAWWPWPWIRAPPCARSRRCANRRSAIAICSRTRAR